MRGASRLRALAWTMAVGLALAATVLLVWRLKETGPPGEAGSPPSGASAPERPNVVLITIDTLRADRLGSYGAKGAETPNLDRLASEGVRFANAATTVPFTLPAHSSLMTGTYPPFHGVRENVGYQLDDRLPTLAERLAAGGWATGGFVSSFVLDSRWGIGRGFDTFFDDFDPHETESSNLASVQRDGGETIAEAVRWLDARPPGQSAPFFLWVHLYDPHDPYTPPEPYRSRHPGRPYEGEVAYADALVGRLRQALVERGLLDGSFLVVTADHGEGLGQHGEGFHGFFVYDSTIHVPLIVRPPSRDAAGTVIDAAVSHVDLLPTILEATGQPIPPQVQGRSLLALMAGEEDLEDSPRQVYSESMYPLLHYGWAPLRSLRTSRHKFIEAPRPELFDLTADPQEAADVIRHERRLQAELTTALDRMVERIGSGGQGQVAPAELDEETLEQLEALGYLAGRGGVALAEESARERADPKDRIDLHQLVMMAQSELGKGDVETAKAHLEDAVAKDPSMVDPLQMLGSIAMQQERFAAAVESFRSALAVKEDHLASLFGLANAYRRLGQSDDALLGFEQVLRFEPLDPKALSAVAELLDQQGRRDEAIARLTAAVAGDDAPGLLLNQLGELRALDGERDAATELFQAALAANSDLVVARFNLAVLYEEGGRVDEAIGLYQETLEEAPKHFQAQFNLGRLYGASGRPQRQRELWEASIVSNPEFARGYLYLAKLLMDRGEDLRRAEALVRQGLDKDPENRSGPLGYYILADILNRTGRSREAAQAVESGRRIESEQRGQ